MSSNKKSAQAEVPPRVYKDVVYSTIYPIKTLAGIPVTRSLHPETQAGRKEFRETFHSNFWNRPGAEYDSLTKDQLAGKKALVIAIQYTTLWNWLPGTFVDALKVANMLQTQYGYRPECIRVLADQFNAHNSADLPRWPSKDVIMEGLRWLGEDCSDDSECQRFLYFSGLGYHLGSGSVASGIIPIDHRKMPGFDGSAAYIDPKTVIFGQDINNCLVDSLCGKRVKLTVVHDCYFGKGRCITDFQPELLGFTRIRGRNLFQSRLAGLGEAGTRMEDLPVVGNLLNLPVKIQLGSAELISSNTIVPSDKVNLGTMESNSGKEEFKAFSESCQVCWIAPESTAEIFEGGWFTSVFVESLTQPGLSGMCKYGELHGHLRTALDKLNDLHSHVCGTEQTGKNEKALPGYFYLNQYASQNVVGGFEDKLVEL